MYQGVFCCETQLEYLTKTSPEVSQKTSVVWYPSELDDLLGMWRNTQHLRMIPALEIHFFFPLLTFLVHNDCIFSTRTGTASRFQVWRSINYSQHRCSMCQWSNDHHPSIILPSSFHHSFMPMKSPSVAGCASPPAMRAASPPIRASGRYKATSTAAYPLIMGLMRIMMVKTCWLMLNMVNYV